MNMKPENWDDLTIMQKGIATKRLLDSSRGFLVLSKALHYGLQKMKEVPAPYTEISDIQDIEMIREMLYNFPVHTEEELRAMSDELLKVNKG
jgi:hypothetical protein